MADRGMVNRLLKIVRIDFRPAHRQPSSARVVLATVAAVAGSLAADAVLVGIGTAIFPGTKHYVHFRFPDYGKLTVIGVVAACMAWPIVTRLSSSPRWIFIRLAALVTLVLWLPDAYILYRGQPPHAVAILMLMHLAIALVTYNALVRMAPVGSDDDEDVGRLDADPARGVIGAQPVRPGRAPDIAGLGSAREVRRACWLVRRHS